MKIGDRVIVHQILDETEEVYVVGDYGVILDSQDSEHPYCAVVRFKRVYDQRGNARFGRKKWLVDRKELMVCEPRTTWKQVEAIADILREEV